MTWLIRLSLLVLLEVGPHVAQTGFVRAGVVPAEQKLATGR